MGGIIGLKAWEYTERVLPWELGVSPTRRSLEAEGWQFLVTIQRPGIEREIIFRREVPEMPVQRRGRRSVNLGDKI
jgi:hypothetical protein